jgi:hypothetical protein
MENVDKNIITLSEMFNNQFNYLNIISILPGDEKKIWERSLNNLMLTKIEEHFDIQCENITNTNYEILVIIINKDIYHLLTFENK